MKRHHAPWVDARKPGARFPRTGLGLLIVGLLGVVLGSVLFPTYLLNDLGPLFVIVFLVGIYWTVINGTAWLLRRQRGRDRSGGS